MKKIVFITLILTMVFAFSSLAHALITHEENHSMTESLELTEHHCLCSHFLAFESCEEVNFDFGVLPEEPFNYTISFIHFDYIKNLYRPPIV